MRNIFIGFLLIFFNFSIDTDGSKIGLIPDFIGYISILRGAAEMVDKSDFFSNIKPYVTGMLIYSSVLYVFDLFGFTLSYPMFGYILGFISTAISLFISYNIVMGINYIERTYSCFLNGIRLMSMWKLLAFVNIIAYLLMIIPLLALLTIIAVFIINIFFLIEFNTSKNMYYGRFK
ncbi:MAG: hypothetical protein GX237_04990 [Clostridiales bacterium]|nr:hypothetical protein [Clostridiales bacterium]